MTLKVGEPVEFEAIVWAMYPQQDNEVLVALELGNRYRLSLHDRWLIRTAKGSLSEGESVRIRAKITRVAPPWVTVRFDGSTIISTIDQKWVIEN